MAQTVDAHSEVSDTATSLSALTAIITQLVLTIEGKIPFSYLLF